MSRRLPMMLLLLSALVVSNCVRPARPAPRHDIQIRDVDGELMFWNTATDSLFVPRGANYIRLADRDPGTRIELHHSTFDTDQYDPERAEAALALMQRLGYNTVRVFLNVDPGTGIGDPDGTGLSPTYVGFLLNFISLAAAHDVYVIITHDWLPDSEPYRTLVGRDPNPYGGFNRLFLTAGGVEANAQFWADLADQIVTFGLTDHVLAYQIQNEFFYSTDEYPFNDPAAVVTTGDGGTYRMSSPAEVQTMMDSNMLHLLNTVTAAIQARDAEALVTNGYFVPHGGDPRQFNVVPAYDSDLDFLDLHIYPHEFHHEIDGYIAAYGLTDPPAMPILVGEFGAFRGPFGPLLPGSDQFRYTSNADAAVELANWQALSCPHVDGWLTWTWDGDEQSHLYTALGNPAQGDLGVDLATGPVRRGDGRTVPITDPEHGIVGMVAYYLSPLARPDPCTGLVRAEPP